MVLPTDVGGRVDRRQPLLEARTNPPVRPSLRPGLGEPLAVSPRRLCRPPRRVLFSATPTATGAHGVTKSRSRSRSRAKPKPVAGLDLAFARTVLEAMPIG